MAAIELLLRMLGAASGPLQITDHPDSIIVDAGQTASFAVAATGGTQPLSYQWQVESFGTWSAVNPFVGSGQQTPNYTTQPTTAEMNGLRYRCQVTDADLSELVWSIPATLSVNK